MSKRVTIVNYGLANLYSVSNAFKSLGAEVLIADSSEQVKEADCLVLPGVGAFKDAMQLLEEKGLDLAIKEYIALGKPFLGICVGMQVLFERSFEFGVTKGLGVIKGDVVQMKGDKFKIPFINWSGLYPADGGSAFAADSILSDLKAGDNVYFVHSYMGVPEEVDYLACSFYEGEKICAAVKRGNVTGVQFHPEKSGIYGMQILARFYDGK